MIHQKNIHNAWQRQYRKVYTQRKGEISFQIVLEESDLHVIANTHMATAMLKTLGLLRADIKSWQSLYTDFRSSLVPLPIPQSAPEVVKRMYIAAKKAGVGPFAAVAGTIAHMLAEDFVSQSSNIIIENGGDLYMYSQTPRVVALLSNPNSGASLGLQFSANDFPLALCTSSATIGHSLSLGQGELAVVRSKDGALADTVATALGNRLQDAASLEQAMQFAQNINGVEGIFVQCNEAIGVWGKMELTHL